MPDLGSPERPYESPWLRSNPLPVLSFCLYLEDRTSGSATWFGCSHEVGLSALCCASSVSQHTSCVQARATKCGKTALR